MHFRGLFKNQILTGVVLSSLSVIRLPIYFYRGLRSIYHLCLKLFVLAFKGALIHRGHVYSALFLNYSLFPFACYCLILLAMMIACLFFFGTHLSR